MNKLNIIGLLLLIFISSCRKDINDVTENVTTDPPAILNYVPIVENITGSLIGQVVDENNEPMADVKIKMNGLDYFTNQYGHFIINDVTMNSRGQLVQAFQNATHFPGSRRFFPKAGVQSKVKIQMIKKDFTDEFAATDGGEITMNGNAKVVFEPGSIKDSNGNNYEGTVMVASHWLDPMATATLDQMPGNLQGVNLTSDEVALQTYGMIAVELQAPDGEKLNIADGKTAQVSVPVADEQLANAPDEMPLWSYNEEYGLWAEESSATLQNDVYVGEVSHFSFWNWDYPYELIEFDVTFTDQNDTPLSDFIFSVSLANGAVAYGYPDANGVLSGLVPANEVLTLTVQDFCGDVVFTQEVGPFSTNTSLGTIVLTLDPAYTTTIQGTLIDCNGDAVTNGVVIATIDGYSSYYYVTDGAFDQLLTVPACATVTSDYSIVGVNLDTPEQGLPVTATAQTNNDLGDLSTCGSSLENYILLTIDGETKYVLEVGTDPGGTFTYLYGGGTNAAAGIGFEGTTVGDYSSSNFIEIIEVDGWGIQSISPDLPAFSNFQVTQYDTKIVGTFSGQVINNGTEVFLEGEFNVTL